MLRGEDVKYRSFQFSEKKEELGVFEGNIIQYFREREVSGVKAQHQSIDLSNNNEQANISNKSSENFPSQFLTELQTRVKK